MNTWTKTLTPLAFLSMAVACDGSAPHVTQQREAMLPNAAPPRAVALEEAPSASDSTSLEAADEYEGECLQWDLVEQTFNEETGAFSSTYECPEGGAIASQVTEGIDNGDGSGQYDTTIFNRDGTQLVWSFEYSLEPDGATQIYSGSATDGSTYEGEYIYLPDGSTLVEEIWNYAEGTYLVDGMYSAGDDVFGQPRFNGVYTFDDPSTEPSPDYVVEQSHELDGTITNDTHSEWENWISDYIYVSYANGEATYDYANDDTTTSASPDYAGSYVYFADGSAEGIYEQLYDDGSVVTVSQSFHTMQLGYQESWSFDDANTAQLVDQEGSMVYLEDGSGSGTITTFVVGGDAETCDVSVSVDGTTTIDNCR